MERKKIFENVENINEFILKYKNSFEKRKYFLINDNYELEYREPSFILELSQYYFGESDNVKKEIEINLANEFQGTYIDKNKRIERMSKIENDKLSNSFKRALINQDKVHSVKLGNELFYRNKDEFFEILYNLALISMDINKLIKVYFTEELFGKVEEVLKEQGNNSFGKKREIVDEIMKNIINYFTKSENNYINYNKENDMKYFLENRVDLLYKLIYEKKYDEIVKKYNVKGNKKLNFENIEYDYEKLSESKKMLYNLMLK